MTPMFIAWVILVMNTANASHGWLFPAGPFEDKALCGFYIASELPPPDDSFTYQCVQVALPVQSDGQ